MSTGYQQFDDEGQVATLNKMSIEYQQLEGQKKKTTCLQATLCGTCVGLLLVTVAFIWYAAAQSSSSSSNSTECTTTSCVALADAILSSIDDSVDPCDDFYQYACGNFIKEYDWELIDSSSYGQFDILTNTEMETVLDAFFYDTNASLIGHSSIIKAINFYASCYDSSVTAESLEESSLLTEFVSYVNFSNGNDTWDPQSRNGFISAMAWLSARDWNYLWHTSTYMTGVPIIYQNYEVWLQYNSSQLETLISETFVPYYQQIFGLNQTDAELIGEQVLTFADSVKDITTASSLYYDQSALYATARAQAFVNISKIFTPSNVLNWPAILTQTFNVQETEIEWFIYFSAGIEFFNNLTILLENTPPEVVQYFLFTDVLIYGLNFGGSLEQSRYMDRTEYCFYQLLEEYPFVYGYILDNELWSDSKNSSVYDLVYEVLEDGVRDVIDGATWMDTESRENSIKKVDYLGIYVGLPPKVGNYTALDGFYQKVNVTGDGDDFVDNLASMLNFDVYVTQATFNGSIYDIISPWPESFLDSSSYDSWLTGINAFYVPTGNFFTIPVTISQIPFFDENYPSAIKFGGLGGVIGHEISHGFDPEGSYYTYNGSNADIWSTSTRASYNELVSCFVSQYNSLSVDGYYVDGNQTITENVADNGGLTASYTAWKEYISTNGDDKTLPGVSLTSEQLFFWSWAHLWCEAATPTNYQNWTDVHSPNPARVRGVVQNSDAFASAFSCKSGSAMNPTDKCTLW